MLRWERDLRNESARPGVRPVARRPQPQLDDRTGVLAVQRTAGNAAVVEWMRIGARPTGRAMVVQRCGPIPRDCSAEEQEEYARSHGEGEQRPTVLRLTEAQFRTQLGSTGEQRVAIDALFANPTFSSLMSYLRSCPATPQQNVGPLRLKVTPGLRIGGDERFGGYNPITATLEINPAKREHVSNPTELVDTIVHELIHAIDDLQTACIAAGSGPAPLAGGATATAPDRAAVAGTPEEARLMQEQGPGASDPCGEFIDINDAAQRMIVSVMQNNIVVSGVGRPTLTFVNTIIRDNPAAMTSFETCRQAAPRPAASSNQAVGQVCGENHRHIIPPALQTALLPTRVRFGNNSTTVSPSEAETINLVALFLKAHPAVTVNLVGHTDPTGSVAVNLAIGQRRVDTVKALLLAKGAPPAQVGLATSVGKAGLLSTKPEDHFLDRRVEISP